MRLRPIVPSSSMKMMDGASKRALEQVAHATRGDAHEHLDEFRTVGVKNGNPASPATVFARSVFPVPGGPSKRILGRFHEATLILWTSFHDVYDGLNS